MDTLTLVPVHADRRPAFGPGRGGTAGGGEQRGTGAATPAAAGTPGERGPQDAFARVLAATCAGPERATAPALPGAGLTVATLLGASRANGRPDEARTGRSSAGSGAAGLGAATVGRRVDVAA